MVFNWNDQDQVGSTLWPDLTESEGHVVPHPMETGEGALFPTGDCKKCDESFSTDTRPIEQSSRTTNGHISYKSDGSSNFYTNEELQSSIIGMDTLFAFPNLCVKLKDEFAEENNHDALTELMNDIPDATSLNSIQGDSINLDHEPDLFGHEDRESNNFLDCDWATFGDLDDIEKLFRNNDSIFGHDMIGDVDGFLSPSKDVIDSTAQSIPMPDLPLCKGHMSDEGCSSFQIDDRADKQESPLQKEKVEGKKTAPNCPNKVEERRKNRPSKNSKDNYDQNQCIPNANVNRSVTTPLQFQSIAASQPMPFGVAKHMEQHGSSNQVTFVQHEYPTLCFPSMQLPTHPQTNRNQKRPTPATYEVRSDDTKHRKTSNILSDAKPATMTPQEKAEKLRRLQQIQAQLAIEQQQQHYSPQITGANVSVSQSFSQNNQSLDAMASTITTDECTHNAPSKDEPKETSGLPYDTPTDENIYHRLQDVVGKLDMRVRLCIRDSLFRLARSAIARQSASDGSSTNTGDRDEVEVSAEQESRNHDRSSTMVGGLETGTNHIDRIVAKLLFQRPTEACPRFSSSELTSSS